MARNFVDFGDDDHIALKADPQKVENLDKVEDAIVEDN